MDCASAKQTEGVVTNSRVCRIVLTVQIQFCIKCIKCIVEGSSKAVIVRIDNC